MPPGGGAWIDASRTLTGAGPLRSVSSSFDLSQGGWSYGAGVENAINRNWSWKLEYLHMQTDRFSTNVVIFGASTVWNAKLADNVVRAGINYRF